MSQQTIRRATILVLGLLALVSALPASAGSRIERELDLAPGGRFVLEAGVGAVSVTGTSRSGARVVITSDRDDLDELFAFDFAAGEGTVHVTAKRKGAALTSWFSWGSKGDLRWEIQVPTDTALDIGTSGGSITIAELRGVARLDTSGGGITIANVEGAVDADTSGGAISVSNVFGDVKSDTSGGGIEINGVAGNVDADTSGGSIQIYKVTGEITAETSGGSIRINEAGGRVFADTSGGGIQVAFVAGNSAGGTLSTSGGGIRVVLDPTSRLELDAASSGGAVICDVPIEVRGQRSRSSLSATMGGGGERLKLRASGGPIRIEAL
jgi:hypothetical protein